MKKTEKNINISQAEEEISRLGFDYKSMMETILYADNNYAMLTEGLKLNVNTDRHTYDQVNIQFGIDCAKRQPVALSDMFIRLVRYSGNSYEGIELNCRLYRKDFPTKTELLSEMQKELEKHDCKNRTGAKINNERINRAKQIHSAMNSTKKGSSINQRKIT